MFLFFSSSSLLLRYVQFFVVFLIYVQCRGLHTKCWPGWSRKHITRARVCEFLKMYLPAALSIGSDFWRMAVIGILAASVSADDLGVFNSSYVCACRIYLDLVLKYTQKEIDTHT